LVDYYLWTDGSASSADSSHFSGPTAGTVSFAPGQSRATIEIAVNPDTPNQPNEGFHVSLANARGDTIAGGSAAATIGGLVVQPLADGGHVEVRLTPQGEAAQTYDAGGAAVGSALTTQGTVIDTIVPLAHGGYAMAVGNFGQQTLVIADASNHLLVSQGGRVQTHIAAAADGTVLVANETFSTKGAAPNPSLTLYDAGGAVVAQAAYESGAVPSVSIDDSGHYVIARADLQPMVVDSAAGASAFQVPAAISGAITGIDDSGPLVGTFAAGAYIDDSTPTFRIPVDHTGGVETQYPTGGPFGSIAETPVTPQDVARGYVEVHLSDAEPRGQPVRFSLVSDTGVVGPSTAFSYAYESTAPLAHVAYVDGQAASSGGSPTLLTTSKSDPGVVIQVSDQQIGDTLQLLDNGVAVGAPVTLGAQAAQSADFGFIFIPMTGHVDPGSNQLWVETLRPDGQVLEGAHATVVYSSPAGAPTLSIAAPDPTHEGTSGTADFAFTLTRTGDAAASALVG
jgi:hypothetical protein